MVDYHPFSQQVIDDPQAIYQKLREEDPCFYLEEWDCFFLSRFEDIWEASMDGENYSTEEGVAGRDIRGLRGHVDLRTSC